LEPAAARTTRALTVVAGSGWKQRSLQMQNTQKTAIVTGGSQGIGAGLVKAFLDRGYNVVANSRNITKSGASEASDKLALVDGNAAEAATAAKIAEAAKSKFGSIDALVNNAGIYFSKPFTDYTVEDLRSLVSVNIEGFLVISQLAIKQMLAQKTGGSIVNITAAYVNHPIAGMNSAVPMITKGGLEAVTRSLAMEYAKQGIRVNAVAPGIVDTPMHKNDPKDFLKTLQPMGQISDVKDIVDAIIYLTEAGQVTGEVLHVDGGAHVGKW
jgi:NAD(P)-dependent dehydrogenase (short-subunit alcohol dehydrogenase family)